MKKRKKLGLFIIGSTVVFTMIGMYLYQMFTSPNFLVTYTDTTGKEHKTDSIWVVIPDDTSYTFDKLSESLYKRKVLHDQMSFAFVAKVMGYKENIKPGLFLFRADWSNLDAVRHLRVRRRWETTLSFNSVRLKEQLPELVTKNIYRADDYEKVMMDMLNNDSICKSFGFDTTTIGCMFIPNTYNIYRDTDAEGIMNKIKAEYDKFWTDERKTKAEKLGLTPIQVSILASIVNAETNKNDEKARVAGVYLNRLSKGMMLQADPTVKFAVGDFELRRILNKHLTVDSPYNTYKYTGLPPGPINIPDTKSIDAVLNFETHDYIYFCAKEDFSGYHNFAKTLSEHNKNARIYQQALNARGIR